MLRRRIVAWRFSRCVVSSPPVSLQRVCADGQGRLRFLRARKQPTGFLVLAASWIFLGRLLPVPVATAVLVVLFGALTFLFDDPTFIKRKPTIVNLLFAGILLFGLMTGRPLLRFLFGEAFKLTEEGWRKLTIRWTVFFVLLAALNELVWRNFSDAIWANFKFFGILGLSLVFGVAQIGLIKRYEAKSGT